jgi:thiamine-phosphate pyrophosphorylase
MPAKSLPLAGLPRVYPITDKRLAQASTHLAIVRELARGGATLVQVRDKETPVRELLADLERCVEFCRAKGLLLLVNDRCDLALSVGAAGVHLGQDDLPSRAARELLGPDRILGLSTHSPLQVRGSRRLPVDYIGFGPVYATGTKPGANPETGLAGLRRACSLTRRPVVAIGGIGLDQIQEVLAAGAASAAVISAVMRPRQVARRMEELLRATETV